MGALDECFATISGPWSSVDNTETIRAVLFWFFIHQSQLVPLYLTWLIFRDLTFWDWEHFIPKITLGCAPRLPEVEAAGLQHRIHHRHCYIHLAKLIVYVLPLDGQIWCYHSSQRPHADPSLHCPHFLEEEGCLVLLKEGEGSDQVQTSFWRGAPAPAKSNCSWMCLSDGWVRGLG